MAQYDINLREYWRILKKRKFMVISTAIVICVFSTFFAVLKAPLPLYTAVSSIKFEKESTVEGLYTKTLSWSPSDDIETQVSIIQGYSVFKKVAERMGLFSVKNSGKGDQLSYDAIRIIEGLQSKVEVTRESFTNILNIQATDSRPAFAQELANTIALTYRDLHAEQQARRTNEAIKYIKNQLATVREKLRESEDEFNRFSQENQLLSIDMQSENILTMSQEIENQIRALRDDRTELEGIVPRLEKFLKNPSGSDNNFYSAKSNSQFRASNDKLMELLLKKDSLLEDYTPQHPEVIGINRKIVESARKMLILLKLQIKEMEGKEAALIDELKKVNKKTSLLMDKKLEFNRLKRKVELYNDMTALLEKKNQEALIRKAEEPEEITIVKPALPPSAPINPPQTVSTGAMGAIIGLIIGLIIAFIVETFDTSLGAIEDVEETLGAQVLGVVPHGDTKEIQESIKGKYPGGLEDVSMKKMVNLVSHFAPRSMMAESFRALRTNIQFKYSDKKVKTIAVTSASPQEGKTLVTTNLAITMAQSGLKTLLIGSDLRKPMLGRVFGVEITPGLTDILLGNHPWRDTVKTITDIIMGKMSPDEVMMTPGMDNLHIITSGSIPPNPSELIDSGHLLDFIQEAREEYDIIIFDSPPILSTADAAILGTKVDGVLFVYRVGTVSKGLLKRATTQLEQVQCNFMGIILNGMKPELSPDFQDYKYYRYYYASDEEEEYKEDRKQKKGLLFFRKKGGKARPSAKKSHPEWSGKKHGKKGRHAKGAGVWKVFLVLVATVFLTAGILWQNGIIDPVKWLDAFMAVTKDLGKSSGKKKRVPKGVSKKQKAKKDVHAPETKAKEEKKQPRVKKPPVTLPETTRLKEPDRPALSPLKTPGPSGDIAESGPRSRLKEKTGSPVHKPEGAVHTYPFSLRLGSFRTLELAGKAISIYGKKGISAYWTKVDLDDKGVWFRVYTGHFEDREQAEKFKNENHLLKADVKETKYAVRIGVYPRGAVELGNMLRKIKDLGYSPYLIERSDNKCVLHVGAFLTRKGAESQYHDLESTGIKGRVVRR